MNWKEAYNLLQKSDNWNELKKYVKDFDENHAPELNDIWMIMNQVWEDMGLNNRKYDSTQIGKYYAHPVWFLNGLFIEIDEASINHRKSIAGYFKEKSKLRILDYGGGFGTLAKEIAQATPSSAIDFYEPYASEYTFRNIHDFKNIKVIGTLEESYYDVLVNTDILEHVEDPIGLVAAYNKYLKKNGILISHWNFTPCIKCHLPENLHFRYTFHRIVPILGFSKEIIDDRHGHYFVKQREIKQNDFNKAYRMEILSKSAYPMNKSIEKIKTVIKKYFIKYGIYNTVKRALRR